MEVHAGDTIFTGSLNELLDKSRENIFNTRLFNLVTVEVEHSSGFDRITIVVSVIERWYIWPIPFFQISDRNLNAWWESRDFSRLTYGVDLTFYNMRGRNETLKLIAHFGFNQSYGLSYKIPYINRKQTIGIGFGATVDINREVPVYNEQNQPVYYKNGNQTPLQLIFAYADLIIRPNYFTTHTLSIEYNRYYLSDDVLSIPGFSLADQKLQEFFNLCYMIKNDHRDVHFYPLQGYYFDIQVNLSVPNTLVENTWVKTYVRKYWKFAERLYFAAGFIGQASLGSNHPYYLARGVGYGRDFIRGYEVYVVDGQHFALLKTNLKYAIIPLTIYNIRWIRTTKFNTVPYALYANCFFDMGYVYAPDELFSTNPYLQNDLQNKLMAGAGLGIDFTTYYDIVIRLEGSINLMAKPGFAVHLIAPI
jgi:outer membrane protein assembly factor BamA